MMKLLVLALVLASCWSQQGPPREVTWDYSEWQPILTPCPSCRQSRILQAKPAHISTVPIVKRQPQVSHDSSSVVQLQPIFQSKLPKTLKPNFLKPALVPSQPPRTPAITFPPSGQPGRPTTPAVTSSVGGQVHLVYLPEGSIKQLQSANAARIVPPQIPQQILQGIETIPAPLFPQDIQAIDFSDKQKRDHEGRIIRGGVTNALPMSLITTLGHEEDAREKLKLLEAALVSPIEQEEGKLPRVFIAPSHVPPPPGYVKIPLVPEGKSGLRGFDGNAPLPLIFLTPDARNPPPGFVKFDLPSAVSQLSRDIPVVVPNSQVEPNVIFNGPSFSPTPGPNRPDASLNFQTQGIRTGKNIVPQVSAVQVISKGAPKSTVQPKSPAPSKQAVTKPSPRPTIQASSQPSSRPIPQRTNPQFPQANHQSQFFPPRQSLPLPQQFLPNPNQPRPFAPRPDQSGLPIFQGQPVFLPRQPFPHSGQPIQQPGQTFPRPGQSISQSGQFVPQAGQPFTQTNPGSPRPDHRFIQQNQPFLRPGQTFQRPNPPFPQPGQPIQKVNQPFSQPGQTFVQSGQSFPRPLNHFPQPNQSFSQPGQSIFRSPHTQAQPDFPNINRPLQRQPQNPNLRVTSIPVSRPTTPEPPQSSPITFSSLAPETSPETIAKSVAQFSPRPQLITQFNPKQFFSSTPRPASFIQSSPSPAPVTHIPRFPPRPVTHEPFSTRSPVSLIPQSSLGPVSVSFPTQHSPRPTLTSTSRPAFTSDQRPPFTSFTSTPRPPFTSFTSTPRPPFTSFTSTQRPPFTSFTSTPRPTFTSFTSTPRPRFTSSARPTFASTSKPTFTPTPKPLLSSSPRPLLSSSPRPFLSSSPRPLLSSSPRPILTSSPHPILSSTPRPQHLTFTPQPIETSSPFDVTPRPPFQQTFGFEDSSIRSSIPQDQVFEIPSFVEPQHPQIQAFQEPQHNQFSSTEELLAPQISSFQRPQTTTVTRFPAPQSPRIPSFQRPTTARPSVNEDSQGLIESGRRQRLPVFPRFQRPRVTTIAPEDEEQTILPEFTTPEFLTPAPTTLSPTTPSPATTTTVKVTTFKPKFNFNLGNRRPIIRRKPRPTEVGKKELGEKKTEVVTLFPPFSVARTLNPLRNDNKGNERISSTGHSGITVPPAGTFGRRLRPRTKPPSIRSEDDSNVAASRPSGQRARGLVGNRARELPDWLKARRRNRGRFRGTPTTTENIRLVDSVLEDDLPLDILENNEFSGAESTLVVFSRPPENAVAEFLNLQETEKRQERVIEKVTWGVENEDFRKVPEVVEEQVKYVDEASQEEVKYVDEAAQEEVKYVDEAAQEEVKYVDEAAQEEDKLEELNANLDLSRVSSGTLTEMVDPVTSHEDYSFEKTEALSEPEPEPAPESSNSSEKTEDLPVAEPESSNKPVAGLRLL